MPESPNSDAAPAAITQPRPGPEPRATPAARWLAILLGLALLGVAGVFARDMWYRWGAKNPEDSWVAATLDWAATQPANALAVAIGIALALVGLWILLSAFAPRARTHVRVASEASIWVRPVDIARRATHVSRSQTGGTHALSRASKRRLRVSVEDDGSGSDLQQRVAEALRWEFTPLQVAPRTTVTLQPHQQPTNKEDIRR